MTFRPGNRAGASVSFHAFRAGLTLSFGFLMISSLKRSTTAAMAKIAAEPLVQARLRRSGVAAVASDALSGRCRATLPQRRQRGRPRPWPPSVGPLDCPSRPPLVGSPLVIVDPATIVSACPRRGHPTSVSGGSSVHHTQRDSSSCSGQAGRPPAASSRARADRARESAEPPHHSPRPARAIGAATSTRASWALIAACSSARSW